MGLAVLQLATKISFSDIAQRNSERIIRLFEKRLQNLDALQKAIQQLPADLKAKVMLHGSSAFIFFCAFQKLLNEAQLQHYADYLEKADFDLLILPDEQHVAPKQVYDALVKFLPEGKFKALDWENKDCLTNPILDCSSSLSVHSKPFYPSLNTYPTAYPYFYEMPQFPNLYGLPSYADSPVYFSPYPINYYPLANNPVNATKKNKLPASYLHIEYEKDGQKYDVTCSKNTSDENHGQLPWLLKADVSNDEIIFLFKDDAHLARFNDFFAKCIIRVPAIESFDITAPVTDNFIRLVAFLCKSVSRYSKMREILLHNDVSVGLKKIFQNKGLKDAITSKIDKLYGKEEDFYKTIIEKPVFVENPHANSPASSVGSDTAKVIDTEVNTLSESRQSQESSASLTQSAAMSVVAIPAKKNKKEKSSIDIIPMPEPVPIVEEEFKPVKKRQSKIEVSSIAATKQVVVIDGLTAKLKGVDDKADSSSDSEPEKHAISKEKTKKKAKKNKKLDKIEEEFEFKISAPKKLKIFDGAKFVADDLIEFVIKNTYKDFSVEDLKKCLRKRFVKENNAEMFVKSVFNFVRFVSKWIWYFHEWDLSYLAELSAALSDKHTEYFDWKNFDEISIVINSIEEKFDSKLVRGKESANLLVRLLRCLKPEKKENFKNDLEAILVFKDYVKTHKIELNSEFNVLTAVIFSQVSGIRFFGKHFQLAIIEFHNLSIKSDYIHEKLFVYHYLKTALLFSDIFFTDKFILAEKIKQLISVDGENLFSMPDNRYYTLCAIIRFYGFRDDFEWNMAAFFGNKITNFIFKGSVSEKSSIKKEDYLVELFFEFDLFCDKSRDVYHEINLFVESFLWYFNIKLIESEDKFYLERVQFFCKIKEIIILNKEKMMRLIKSKHKNIGKVYANEHEMSSLERGQYPNNLFLREIIHHFCKERMNFPRQHKSDGLGADEFSGDTRKYFETKKIHIELLLMLLDFAFNKPEDANIAHYFNEKSPEMLAKMKNEILKSNDEIIKLFDFSGFLSESIDMLTVDNMHYSDSFFYSAIYVLSRAEIYNLIIGIQTSDNLNLKLNAFSSKKLNAFSSNELTILDKLFYGVKNKSLDRKYSVEIFSRFITDNFKYECLLPISIKYGLKYSSGFYRNYFQLNQASEGVLGKDYIELFYNFYADPILNEKKDHDFGEMTPQEMWDFLFVKCKLKPTLSFREYISMVEGALIGYYANRIVKGIESGNAAKLMDALILIQDKMYNFYTFFSVKVKELIIQKPLGINPDVDSYYIFIHNLCLNFEDLDGINSDSFLCMNDNLFKGLPIDYYHIIKKFIEKNYSSRTPFIDLYQHHISNRVRLILMNGSGSIFIGHNEHFNFSKEKNDVFILCLYFAFLFQENIQLNGSCSGGAKVKSFFDLKKACEKKDMTENVFVERVFVYVKENINPKDKVSFVFWCNNVIESCVKYKTGLQVDELSMHEDKKARLEDYRKENAVLVNSLCIIREGQDIMYQRYQSGLTQSSLSQGTQSLISFMTAVSQPTAINSKHPDKSQTNPSPF